MTVDSIIGVMSISSQIEKQRRAFDSLHRPWVLRSMLEQQAKQDPLLGLRTSSMLEQIVHDRDGLGGMLANKIQPSALQALIDQRKASSQLLELGVNSAMFKGIADAQGKYSGGFSSIQGSFPFHHADLLRISEVAGADRFKMRHDLFQGVADQLVSLGSVKSWPSIDFPPGFAKALAGYEDGLVARYAAGVIAEVEATADTATESDFLEDEDPVWFGAESWSALVWEMVTTLKALELTTAGMWTAKGILKAPIPLGVLYLASMAIVAAELAARFAERAAKRLDGDEN